MNTHFLQKIHQNKLNYFHNYFFQTYVEKIKRTTPLDNQSQGQLYLIMLRYLLANVPIQFALNICDEETELVDKVIREHVFGNTVSLKPKSSFYKDHANKYTEHFSSIVMKEGLSYVFSGTYDTGKTFSALHILTHVLYNNHTGYYIPYLKELKDFHDKVKYKDHTQDEEDLWNYITTCDLLVIDELGKEDVTDKVRTMLENILRTRNAAGKPTILVTNLLFYRPTKDLRGKETIENEFLNVYGNSIHQLMMQSFKVLGFSGHNESLRNRFKSNWDLLEV